MGPVLGLLVGVMLGAAARPSSSTAEVPTPAALPIAAPASPLFPDDIPTPVPDPAAAEGAAVTLAFAGDVMFEGAVAAQLEADGVALLAPIASVLGAADISVVNLETAITTRGRPAAKEFVFRAPPHALEPLRAAGVDVVSLANNHGLDYGAVGLADTLRAAERVGLALVGAGGDATAAYAPHLVTIRGRTIAIVGATQVLDGNLLATWTATDQRPGLASAKEPHLEGLLAGVRAARATVDTVVVFLHWGKERHQCPAERQQILARQLVDAGADVIVGGHAHRLQGAGMLGRAFVAYGLGNFVFYADGGPGADSGILTVTVDGRDVLDATWTPARLSRGIPHPLDPPAAAEALVAWDALRGCAGLAPLSSR